MTTKFAIYFGGFLVLAIGADVFLREGEDLVLLGRKFLELIEYLAFWR